MSHARHLHIACTGQDAVHAGGVSRHVDGARVSQQVFRVARQGTASLTKAKLRTELEMNELADDQLTASE